MSCGTGPKGQFHGESHGRFSTREEAMAAAGHPCAADEWVTSRHGNIHTPVPSGSEPSEPYESWAITEVDDD